MSRILMLQPESTNGVLSNLTTKLFLEFNSFAECELFDESVQRLSKAEFFRYIDNFNPDVLFSFNAAGAELSLTLPNQGDRNLFALFSALHIGWMVDHPVYHIPRLRQVNQRRLVLFPSKDTIDFAESFKLSGTFSALPLAGNALTEMGKNHAERTFDVVIAASWMGSPEDKSATHRYPVSKVVSETISMIQEKPFLDPYYVLLDRFLDNQLHCENDNFLAQLTKELYDYQRKLNRVDIIQSLVDSGLRVALIGKGWQSYLGQRDNVTYFDSIPHHQIVSLYQDAKVVVNVNATNGASERLFDAIDCGAMVYSEFSMMLYDMFGSGNGVLFHNVNAQESSLDLLKNIIAQNETEAWAWSAKQVVLAAHTWKHRAKYLQQIVSAYAS